MNAEPLRPKGTVAVHCGHPDCGVSWWLDPLDPLLPDGPFDCGGDHEADAHLRRAFARLRLFTGVTMGAMTTAEGRRFAAGHAVVHRRDWTGDGLVSWRNVAELDDYAAVAERVNWNRSSWPRTVANLARSEDDIPAGQARALAYRDEHGRARRYVIVPCCREGCGQRVMVDLDSPWRRVRSWSIGGGEVVAVSEPEWMRDHIYTCEDGLGSVGGVAPCRLRLSPVVTELEKEIGGRWTIWEHALHSGTVFFAPTHPDAACGLLLYESEEQCQNMNSAMSATWLGPPSQLLEICRERRPMNDAVRLALEDAFGLNRRGV